MIQFAFQHIIPCQIHKSIQETEHEKLFYT